MNDLTVFTTEAIDTIKQAPMLSEVALDQLEQHAKTIQQAFETKQVYRTDTEARYSVLNDVKFPTTDAKYWQCVREEDVHFSELMRLSFEYRKMQVDIAELEEELQKYSDSPEHKYKKQRAIIELQQKAFELKRMQQIAEHRVREVMQWEKIRAELVEQSPEIDTSDPDTHQKISLTLRFINQYLIALKSGTCGSEMLNIEGLMMTSVNRLGLKAVKQHLLQHYSKEDQSIIIKRLEGGE